MDKPMQPNPAHAVTIEEQVRTSRQNLEKAFKEFHKLLNDKVLDANKSTAQHNTERMTIDNLYKSAVALENVNVSEGVMSLAIIAVREMLKMRDRVNELEYELLKLKRDMGKLPGGPKNAPKE